MLVFVLIMSLATVILLAWVTVVVTRGGFELRATKVLTIVRGGASPRTAPSQPPPDAGRQRGARPDGDSRSGDDLDVELAVRERLYGQRAPRI
jgi:hypothetical protein